MPVRFNTAGGGSDLSDATAVESQVLSGNTFYAGEDNDLRTGSMANRGNVTSTLNCGASYTIPAGYHAGSGKITANSLASQTSATASAASILSGSTAWVNGSKLTGSMPNRGSVSSTLNCGGVYTISAGYHSGSGKITANSLASQTSATASPGNIHSGVTAWVNGAKLTGTAAVHYYTTGVGISSSDDKLWCSCGFYPSMIMANANISGYWYILSMDSSNNVWSVKWGNGQTHGALGGTAVRQSNGATLPLIADGTARKSNYNFTAFA